MLILEVDKASLEKCQLCGEGKVSRIRTWVPEFQQEMGVPENVVAVVVCPLCDNCLDKSNAGDKQVVRGLVEQGLSSVSLHFNTPKGKARGIQ
ncbi:MAG: hypothetical protein K9K64_16850 [Desulfohalobiaceae bacterium]|nr:hypothetical protein [Desulfohalobiaceae bacterium]